MYLNELEIKDTTNTLKSASYPHLHFESDNSFTKIDDILDDFNFPIVNFPLSGINIPAAPDTDE